MFGAPAPPIPAVPPQEGIPAAVAPPPPPEILLVGPGIGPPFPPGFP